MKKEDFQKLESLSDVTRMLGLPKPMHPLITLIDNTNNHIEADKFPHSHVLKFYKISYRASLSGKLKYGQGYFDFDEGGLMFASPGQVIGRYEDTGENSGYTLLIHPDLFLSYPLAKKIRQYGFFSYSANEALHLSDNEKTIIVSIFKILQAELNSRIDNFSQDVIVSQIEVLLNYATRFYKRQFITRKAVNNDCCRKWKIFWNSILRMKINWVLDCLPCSFYLTG
ncbi:hypothetical protein SAMN05192574_105342 [Mucilaginibacter gossypiicola]|uniref:AraC family transcriptional regulator n=1 Tax=Mucilaginibacter gossypiicola TaxID=551995 RepID=A0A1H8M1R4_9SPHI|nr:hypothetical protein [Mucilaginibacter gossypiicola]SEO11078.1 hypothetical protein SAMN05192574_105342 [Mucilaginibacter gossypiicola]